MIPLILLALILGLPGFLIVVTATSLTYVWWMCLYLISLPIWNFVLPMYAYWKFDDFSWGDTRKTAGEKTKKGGIEYEGEFDGSKITMKRWGDFEQGRENSFFDHIYHVLEFSFADCPCVNRSQDESTEEPWRGKQRQRP